MPGVNQSTAFVHNFQLFSSVLAKIACGSDAGGLGQTDEGVGKVMDAKVNLIVPFECTFGWPGRRLS